MSLIFNQVTEISVQNPVIGHFTCFNGPIPTGTYRIDVLPVNKPQVMNDITAAYNQNTFLPQFLKPGGKVKMIFRRFGIVYTHLLHGNIGLRIKMADYRPRTMVQSPAVIFLNLSRQKQ